MSKKKKRILIALLVAVPICILSAAGSFTSLLWLALSDGFPMLAADCNGVNVTISGIVRDRNRSPIVGAAVHVQPQMRSLYVEEAPEETIITDSAGRYTIENFHMYICDVLAIEVAADGFVTRVTTFEPLREYPDVSDLSQTLMFEANFMLRRTS
ncbi:MAG: carboxypeptidase-like regulatory domain-containing protein [Anaerolineae bacterium]